MRPKFGSRPAATAGEITSSDAPSRQSRTTRRMFGRERRHRRRRAHRRRGPSPVPRIQSGDAIERIVAAVNRIPTIVRRLWSAAFCASPSARKTNARERKDDDALARASASRVGSSAVRRPDAWSHVITAAVPLRIAALHVSRRRLIQPGGDGSTISDLAKHVERIRDHRDVQAVRQHNHRQHRTGRSERNFWIEQQKEQREIRGGQQPRKRGVAQHPEVAHRKVYSFQCPSMSRPGSFRTRASRPITTSSPSLLPK